jgi:hypothetical protein
MKPVMITAKEYCNLVPALDKAGAMHSATYEGQTIVGCEAGDAGIALTLAMTATPAIVPAAAPVLLHINDGPGALQTLVTELARAREVAESTAAALKASEARWQAQEGRALKTDKTAAESRANTLYEAVRALAPVVTKATGDKKPVMGVEVEDFTGYEYDPMTALQWCMSKASGAVSVELSPAQTPLLLALLLDLRDYRKEHGDELSPELFYLLNKIESFIRLNTAEFEKLLKAGLYANEGIPGKVVTVPVCKVDKDLSFHVNAQAV